MVALHVGQQAAAPAAVQCSAPGWCAPAAASPSPGCAPSRRGVSSVCKFQVEPACQPHLVSGVSDQALALTGPTHLEPACLFVPPSAHQLPALSQNVLGQHVVSGLTPHSPRVTQCALNDEEPARRICGDKQSARRVHRQHRQLVWQLRRRLQYSTEQQEPAKARWKGNSRDLKCPAGFTRYSSRNLPGRNGVIAAL